MGNNETLGIEVPELPPATQGKGAPRSAKSKVSVWPAEKPPPFKFFVAGTWNDYRPEELQWEKGFFIYRGVVVSPESWDSFQLLIDGGWDMTLYPSITDASSFE